MIKLFLFLFLSYFSKSFDQHDCREKGDDPWVCDYMQHHNKSYSTFSEFSLRKSLLKSIKHTQNFGLTSKSDMFPHELRNNYAFKYKNHKFLKRSKDSLHIHKEAVPIMSPIDLRLHNRVTSVKDQARCGGCFAFASATVLEYWLGQHPKSLSPQTLIDCTSGTGRPDVGCDGGLMEYVFEYAKAHPVTLEYDFPFKGIDRTCPSHKLWTNVAVKDFRVLMIEDNPKAEQQFEHILHQYGPISVGIDSSNMNNYVGGIYPATQCTTDIDHAVTIVGYTDKAWIIKNSWGSQWGDRGYLHLERGKNACGVAEYAVYVKDAVPTRKKLTTKWYMEG